MFIAELPDELFEQILERHEARYHPVLVAHNGEVKLLLAHFAQQHGQSLRVRNKAHRPQDRSERDLVPAVVQEIEHVFGVHDALDVVEVTAVGRNPGEPALDDGLRRGVERLGKVDRNDVRPRNHDLADRAVTELEDRVDHLPLVILNRAFSVTHLSQGADLLLDEEGTLLQPLAWKQHVGKPNQRACGQPERTAEHPNERSEHQCDTLAMQDCERLRHCLDHDEVGKREHQRGDRDADVAEVVFGKNGNQHR